MKAFQLRIRPGRKADSGVTVVITTGNRGNVSEVRVNRPVREEALAEAFAEFVAAGHATNDEVEHMFNHEERYQKRTKQVHRTHAQLRSLTNAVTIKRSMRDDDIPF